MGRRTPKSCGHFPWFVAVFNARLSHSEKVLCWALTKWADWETGECWMSIGRLAEGAGLSDRGTRQIRDRLMGKGIISHVRYPDAKHRKTRTIRLNLDALKAAAAAQEAPPDLNNRNEVPDSAGTSFRLDRHEVPLKPARGTDKQPNEQIQEPTTTTMVTPDGFRGRETIGLLLDVGLGRKKAEELAREHSPEEARAAIRIWRDSGGNKEHVGLVAARMADGSARDRVKKNQRESIERARSHLSNPKQVDQLEALLSEYQVEVLRGPETPSAALQDPMFLAWADRKCRQKQRKAS